MSSRALRKAQRLREEQAAQIAELQDESGIHEEDDTDEDVNNASNIKSKQISFSVLHIDEDEDQDPESQPDTDEETRSGQTLPKSSPSKKKKKKRKKKNKASGEAPLLPGIETHDEIDKALQLLAKEPRKSLQNTDEILLDSSQTELQRLLSIDSRLLNPTNEMKRLFGNAAIGTDDDNNTQGAGRRRIVGRNFGGKGLVGLGLRRNIFAQGKEDWPKATGGGLGMELVEKKRNGTVEYKYVHNGAYQDVQRQFDECVRSMKPRRLVRLLQYNPYHISTLLQVSEIAKQERDHSNSGALLERALFSFGRAVQSTFPKNISEGKARLDFRRPENREFWLAAYRYINNLGMRGTWRTAFEWAKLLLSLDPEHDPYEVSLIIDQLALRARQPQQFISLSESELLKSRYIDYPNIQASRGLAYYQLKDSNKCRASLEHAITNFPWVFSRLFQELEISHTPPSIWGAEPKTKRDKLLSNLYVSRAADLWKTPEAIAMLTGIAEHIQKGDSSQSGRQTPSAAPIDHPIGLNEARHTILTDTPALISLVPRSLSSLATSSSDPLPPNDNIESYGEMSRNLDPWEAEPGTLMTIALANAELDVEMDAEMESNIPGNGNLPDGDGVFDGVNGEVGTPERSIEHNLRSSGRPQGENGDLDHESLAELDRLRDEESHDDLRDEERHDHVHDQGDENGRIRE